MRGRIWLPLVALAALGACGKKPAGPTAKAPASQAAPAAPPARQAGLWEQRVSTGDFVQVSRICLDKAMDERLSWWGAQASQGACQKNLFTRRPDGAWQFSSVCDMGSGGKVATTGVATGDFAKDYQVQAESSTTGAQAPQMNGVRKLTVRAAWQGPCPSDMKPGDISLPGGVKINLLDMGGG